MTKPDKERQAIAELVSGAIIKHAFYCASRADTVASLTDDMVPVFADPSLWEDILKEMIPEHYGDNYIFRTQFVKFTIPINELGRMTI